MSSTRESENDNHRRRRLAQYQGLLLQELTHCEEEDSCIEKYHSLVQLAHNTAQQTMTSFMECLTEIQRNRHEQVSSKNCHDPPILVKLPVGSLANSRLDGRFKRRKITSKPSTNAKNSVTPLKRKSKITAKGRLSIPSSTARAPETISTSAAVKPDDLSEISSSMISFPASYQVNPTHRPTIAQQHQLQYYLTQNYSDSRPDVDASNFLLSNVEIISDGQDEGEPSNINTMFQVLQPGVSRLEDGQQIFYLSAENDPAED